MQRKERYSMATQRKQVRINLLIYQGLRQTEITNIHPQDIDLKSGLIHIKAMIRAMARTLTLKPNQVMLFYEYIHKVRLTLLKSETDRLKREKYF